MSAVWKNLEGYLINGVLPLHRCIASSDHSGVFITDSPKYAPAAVALKLLRIDSKLADAQLARWIAATEFSHPHLIRLFEAGRCQVGQLQFLYALMEHADQTLAQPLQQRALSDDEVREALVPTLSGLAYLHGKNFVHGQLKPSNILAVGEQLKLASDTLRAAGTSADRTNATSAYDAPETRNGIYSSASDIWALGVTICEALTRSLPSALDASGETELPSDLRSPFREVVAKCLSKDPLARPDVAGLESWLRGAQLPTVMTESLQASTVPATLSSRPETSAATEPVESETESDKPATFRLVIRAEIIADEPIQPVRQPLNTRAVALVLGAIAGIVLIWIGIGYFKADENSRPPASADARNAQSQLPVRPPSRVPREAAAAVNAAPPATPATPTVATRTEPPAPLAVSSIAARSTQPQVREPDAPPASVNEQIPDVPRSARQTITGTIRVTVRVLIDQQGIVVSASAKERGPSRYFERLAVDAAKKWTFAPADTQEQRTQLLLFNFTRQGTTARLDSAR